MRKTVTLIGSTRFYQAYRDAEFAEALAGNLVFSVGFFANSPDKMEEIHGQDVGINDEQKLELDRLHFAKIARSDEVLVLNVGGYIGESTRNELSYAWKWGKTIRFLEPDKAPAMPGRPDPMNKLLLLTQQMEMLLAKLELAKPGDKSELDRVYALARTKLQDLIGNFFYWGTKHANGDIPKEDAGASEG